MKNFNITHNKLLLAILATGWLLAGCSDDFLDLKPLSDKTDVDFYQTVEDGTLALIGCYDGLQQAYSNGIVFPVASSVLSDNCFGGTGASDDFNYQMMDEFDKSVSPSQELFGGSWENYYRAIFRCNSLLTNIDRINWEGQEALQTTYEAEARFIRAFNYFDLVRLFGNIPLVEAPTSENIPQADPSAVYALIASDLKFAADNLSSTPYSSAQNDGRVTKWAAESLLGRVFLYYTGYYGETSLPTQEEGVTISKADALSYLEDVIANSGHDLLENYASLWPAASVEDYAGEGNIETIFSIKYTYTSDYDGNTDGNHWMVMYGMRNTDAYPYGRGWGGATVTAAFYNQFSEDDTRRLASIIAVDEEGIDLDIGTQREYTGYYVKKYSPMSTEGGQSVAESLGAVNFQIGQFQDFVSIRFADVLLMAAELGSPNAQEYFNRVRERAYNDPDLPELTLTPERLMEERRLELAFEGIRYWDLLRQGMDVAASAINVSGVEVLSAGEPEMKSITFNPATQGLQQIPYPQITLSNGVLKQNTGW